MPELLNKKPVHILFVCMANEQRSPTAASLLSPCPDMETKSAGTDASEKGTQINQVLVDWADIIFVMSEKEGQASFVKNNFTLNKKPIHDLDIPDIYHRDNNELKALIIKKVAEHIDLKPCLDYLIEAVTEQRTNNPRPPGRDEIKLGDEVLVIEKGNYGTDNYTKGTVKNILTSKKYHPRGIKVRLQDGTIGRVQWKAE